MGKRLLSNQKQAVKIGQTTSNFQVVTCDVTLGSLLGPLFFLICINDIYLSVPQVKCHLFADDICIFHSNKNLLTLEHELNTSLKNVTNWLKVNKLTLNVKKYN